MTCVSPSEQVRIRSRRAFLGRAAHGVGTVALASLLQPSLPCAAGLPGGRGGAVVPTLPPKIKRVIWLCMAGGPSHLETFDYKPKLAAMHGRPMPESFMKGQPIAQLQDQKEFNCMAPLFPFRRFGKCGAEISSLFPHIGSVADDVC